MREYDRRTAECHFVRDEQNATLGRRALLPLGLFRRRHDENEGADEYHRGKRALTFRDS